MQAANGNLVSCESNKLVKCMNCDGLGFVPKRYGGEQPCPYCSVNGKPTGKRYLPMFQADWVFDQQHAPIASRVVSPTLDHIPGNCCEGCES